MSTDINADSNDGSYYNHWLRRKVRKPTPILYNMIEELVNEYKKVKEEKDIKVMEEIQESENLPIRKKLRSYDKLYKDKKDKEVLEDQICERCKTHPDDVNWIQAYDDYMITPFYLFVSNG
jgi:hypothetical protein